MGGGAGCKAQSQGAVFSSLDPLLTPRTRECQMLGEVSGGEG